jgi:hypothetical protein
VDLQAASAHKIVGFNIILSCCPRNYISNSANGRKSDKTIGFAPSVASLGALSFALHKRLADENNGRATWGYSPSTGISLSQDSESAISGSGEDWLENGTSRAEAVPVTQLGDGAGGAPEWLRRTQDGTIEVISREGTTAQIDPLRFCRWLLARCEERGVTVTYPARAVGVLRDANGVLDRVRVSKDGVESTRMYTPWPCLQQASRKAHIQLTVPTSPVYPPPDRSRRMVSACLRDAVPERTNSHPHLVTRRALAAGAQPAVRRVEGEMPRSVRDRHAGVCARMVRARRRRAVSRGSQQHQHQAARGGDGREAERAGN